MYGAYDLILKENEQIYAYKRTLDNETLLVICNFTGEAAYFELPEHISCEARQLLINNYADQNSDEISSNTLKPYEARVYLSK